MYAVRTIHRGAHEKTPVVAGVCVNLVAVLGQFTNTPHDHSVSLLHFGFALHNTGGCKCGRPVELLPCQAGNFARCKRQHKFSAACGQLLVSNLLLSFFRWLYSNGPGPVALKANAAANV